MSAPELDYITVRGFKSIHAIEKLPLRPINLVIGANGSGKSNFIGVFAFLHAIRDGRLQDYVAKAGGAEKVLHFGSKVTRKLEIEISFRRQTNQYKLALAPTDNDELYLIKELVFTPEGADASKLRETELYSVAGGRESRFSRPPRLEIPHWVYNRRGRWSVYHFHDTSASALMKKTCDINDNDFLKPDGANLAAFLYLLRERHVEAYSLIVPARIVPVDFRPFVPQ